MLVAPRGLSLEDRKRLTLAVVENKFDCTVADSMFKDKDELAKASQLLKQTAESMFVEIQADAEMEGSQDDLFAPSGDEERLVKSN